VHAGGNASIINPGNGTRRSQVRKGGDIVDAAKLTLEIPDEVVDAVRLPPQEIEGEFRKELALALYQRGALSLGKARLLAEMTTWEFEELLGNRRVARHYTRQDLQEDVRYALGGK
jgi:predicted HTH domain antitoxin